MSAMVASSTRNGADCCARAAVAKVIAVSATQWRVESLIGRRASEGRAYARVCASARSDARPRALASVDSFSPMPITIRVSAAEGVRYSVLSGDIGDRELVAAFRRSFEASDFDPSLNGLVDLRAVGK